jgi:hypothetical protein
MHWCDSAPPHPNLREAQNRAFRDSKQCATTSLRSAQRVHPFALSANCSVAAVSALRTRASCVFASTSLARRQLVSGKPNTVLRRTPLGMLLQVLLEKRIVKSPDPLHLQGEAAQVALLDDLLSYQPLPQDKSATQSGPRIAKIKFANPGEL